MIDLALPSVTVFVARNLEFLEAGQSGECSRVKLPGDILTLRRTFPAGW